MPHVCRLMIINLGTYEYIMSKLVCNIVVIHTWENLHMEQERYILIEDAVLAQRHLLMKSCTQWDVVTNKLDPTETDT